MVDPELRMVVVNAARTPRDFIDHRVYSCPATQNGFHKSYMHHPAKYIGNYVNKGVKYIGIVAACVRLNKSGPDEVLWKFDDIDDREAIIRAEQARATTRRNVRPCLVFLQSLLSVTDLEYDHAGGPQGSHFNFDLTELAPIDVKDLARKLRETTWSSLKKWYP